MYSLSTNLTGSRAAAVPADYVSASLLITK